MKVAAPAPTFSLQIPVEQVTVLKSLGADTVKGTFVNAMLPSVPLAVPEKVKVPVAAKAAPLKRTSEKLLSMYRPCVQSQGFDVFEDVVQIIRTMH